MTAHNFHRDDATFAQVDYSDISNTPSGTITLTKLTNALSGDIALNDITKYFDGPGVAQGSSGVWFVSGSVTCDDVGASVFYVKLWDGTNLIASGTSTTAGNLYTTCISLAGYISNPSGNIRLSVKAVSSITAKIVFNYTGNSKDSTITAIQIG